MGAFVWAFITSAILLVVLGVVFWFIQLIVTPLVYIVKKGWGFAIGLLFKLFILVMVILLIVGLFQSGGS